MIKLYQIHLETWCFQVKKMVFKGHVDLDHLSREDLGRSLHHPNRGEDVI